MSVEMKDSGIDWIGEIPKHWKVSAIKRNLQLYSGATPKTDNELYWNGGVAWITPADYKTEDRWIECGSRYISEEGFKSCAVTMLPKGSIIFSKRAPIGLVIMNSAPLCTNQGCIGCVPFNGNGDYYYYAMSICSEQFELLGSGTTFKEISATSFSNFILPTPTIEEQYRIANFLDKKCAEIDELIALQEQMIAKLNTYKQAVITETVTKGLDPNVKMKDSGVEWIGEIPEHWETPKMKYYITLYSGDAISVNEFVDNGLYPVYGSGEKIANCNKFNTQSTDILIGRVGARCGCVTLPLQKCWATDNALILQSTLCLNYLYYMLIGANLNNLNTSNAQPLITSGKIKNLNIPLPLASEQQSIANYLDQKCKEIDELISIKKEKIEHLKAYKKSVIYEYVTGKKQVTI